MPRKNFFNPKKAGGGLNQDYERLIACRSVCGQGRYAKLGVFVV